MRELLKEMTKYNILRKKKRIYMYSVMLKVEQDFRDSYPQEAYKNINMFKKGFKLSTTLCKSKHGYIITEREKVMSRWKQYFEELLNPDINHRLVMQNEEQVV